MVRFAGPDSRGGPRRRFSVGEGLTANMEQRAMPTAASNLPHQTIGYARVSTDGQTLDAQKATLLCAGCTKVFSEKQSGAKTDRKELAKALAALLPGDVLLVTRLDRLARSTRD